MFLLVRVWDMETSKTIGWAGANRHIRPHGILCRRCPQSHVTTYPALAMPPKAPLHSVFGISCLCHCWSSHIVWHYWPLSAFRGQHNRVFQQVVNPERKGRIQTSGDREPWMEESVWESWCSLNCFSCNTFACHCRSVLCQNVERP